MTSRRVLALVVAGALLWAAGCSTDKTDRDTRATVPSPSTTASASDTRQVGLPPNVAWWSRGRLHVGEGVIRTTMRQIVTRGGTTIVGWATQHGSHWMILRELRLAELLSTRSLGVRPVLSANGLFAAWTTSVDTHRYDELDADTAFTVTAYDVGRGALTGSTVIESRTSCCDGGGVIGVAGVDNDGSVVIGRYADRAWIWRPGDQPVQLTGRFRASGLSGNDQWPGGVSWTTGSSSGGPAAFARISGDGEVTRVGRVPQAQGGLWSPHGTSYAYSPVLKTVTRPVVWRDGQRQVLRAPRGSWPVAWESDHRILLVDGDLDDPSPRLLRCRTNDGTCEQAGPLLHHAHLADPFVF
jgi:hypothetical protein